jgi:hypothetical protein
MQKEELVIDRQFITMPQALHDIRRRIIAESFSGNPDAAAKQEIA